MKTFVARGFLISTILAALLLTACGNSNNQTGELKDMAFNSSVIGGVEVDESDPIAKSVVAVIDTESGGLCTGSIIAEDLVVTAGHCFAQDPTKLVLIFGTKLPTENAEVLIRRVVDGKLHPRFLEVVQMFSQDSTLKADDVGNWGDISLLKFSGGLPEGYVPAKLLKNASLLRTGAAVTVAGYGEIDGVLRTDSESLRKTEVLIANPIHSSTEVATDQSAGKGVCRGDSGGPAFVKSGGEYLLFGVTSRGYNDPTVDCSHFAIFTNLMAQTEFLDGARTAMADALPEALAAN